jgi:hypothetical protein
MSDAPSSIKTSEENEEDPIVAICERLLRKSEKSAVGSCTSANERALRSGEIQSDKSEQSTLS